MQYINKTVSFYVFLQKIGLDVDYWMPIPELNNYKISISGKIKNICTNNLLKSEYGKGNRNPRVTLGSKGRFYLFTLVFGSSMRLSILPVLMRWRAMVSSMPLIYPALFGVL